MSVMEQQKVKNMSHTSRFWTHFVSTVTLSKYPGHDLLRALNKTYIQGYVIGQSKFVSRDDVLVRWSVNADGKLVAYVDWQTRTSRPDSPYVQVPWVAPDEALDALVAYSLFAELETLQNDKLVLRRLERLKIDRPWIGDAVDLMNSLKDARQAELKAQKAATLAFSGILNPLFSATLSKIGLGQYPRGLTKLNRADKMQLLTLAWNYARPSEADKLTAHLFGDATLRVFNGNNIRDLLLLGPVGGLRSERGYEAWLEQVNDRVRSIESAIDLLSAPREPYEYLEWVDAERQRELRRLRGMLMISPLQKAVSALQGSIPAPPSSCSEGTIKAINALNVILAGASTEECSKLFEGVPHHLRAILAMVPDANRTNAQAGLVLYSKRKAQA